MTQQSNKFLQSLNYTQLMIQQQQSQSEPNLNTQVIDYAPLNLQKIQTQLDNNTVKLVAQKIQKKPDHRCFIIVTISMAILIIIFSIDVYHEKKLQMSTAQIVRRRCYQDYIQNECLNPVDVLKDKCRQLQTCYYLNSRHSIGILQTAAKIVGKTIDSLISHTTILGVTLLIVLIGLALFFAFNSKGAEQIKIIYRSKQQ